MANKIIIAVEVQAASQIEANQIGRYLNTILSKIGKNELQRFAHAVDKNPGIVKKALKFI